MGDNGKWLVVTGSSAGGIEALSRLLANVRRDFPAPIVVAQHLDPQVNSSLAAILTKHTALNVVSVATSETMLPGTVYVIPPNNNVEIRDGSVLLRTDLTPGPKPSIDLLFSSAAEWYGERLVAVVLTGMGSDGTVGAQTVKERGGTVIIQDPASANFPSMPGSISANLVDIVAPIDHIGAELELALGETTSAVNDSNEFNELLQRIQSTNGVDFSRYKMSTLKRRLGRQIKLAGMDSLEKYLTYLERTPGEYERLVANFFIKVTEFFRDPELFTALNTTVIPAIVANARQHGNEIRLWSAGCATGEEAYSLAITVAEILGDAVGDFKIRIFSTDIDEATIARARRGIYSQEALSTLDPEIVARYFTRVEDAYEVNKSIRSMTVFGQHDLAQRAPFPHVDLVLCRNVFIYFTKELQLRTLALFAYSLRQGGYLALGKSETSNPLPHYFKVVDPGLRIFQRIGDRIAIPKAEIKTIAQRPSEGDRLRRRLDVHDSVAETRRTENEANGAFLMESSIGFVAIDRRYDISTINAAARQMLNIHGIAVGDDIVHLLPPDFSRPLRTIFDAALRGEEPSVGGEELAVPSDDEGEPRYITLSAYPRHALAGREIEGANLLVVDVTELVKARHSMEARTREEHEEVARLRVRDERSRERQHNLLEANRQLALANNELRAQTDSLLISAEESTAATEEIETLNEEMQATNEELETLNEEFQATIEELNTTNDELEARSMELQDLVVVSETRHHDALDATLALQAIVDSFDEPMAAVDSRAGIPASNRAFTRLRALTEQNAVLIADETGAAIPFAVLLKRASTGETFHFTYQIVDANQIPVTYRGHVAPLTEDGASGSLMRLRKSE